MTTPEVSKDIFKEVQAAFAPIVGSPNDDDVKRLTEAFINALQSMAPPGTSIDWSVFMNASVRRLTLLSFGALTIGGEADCTSLKRSLATSGVVIAAVVSSRRREGQERREGAQWRARGPCGGERGRGGMEG